MCRNNMYNNNSTIKWGKEIGSYRNKVFISLELSFCISEVNSVKICMVNPRATTMKLPENM